MDGYKLLPLVLLLLLPTVHAAFPLAITSSAFPVGFAGEYFALTYSVAATVLKLGVYEVDLQT